MIASFAALYVAGLVTFLSPCTLPMLPFYLAAIGGGGASPRKMVRSGLGFAIGLAIVFVALGAAWSALASAVGEHRRAFVVVGGVLVALAGLKLLGVVRLPCADREARPLLSRVRAGGGFVGGLAFGAAFAFGWTPCVGPVLAGALTYSASSGASTMVAAAQLAAYAAGLATPLVAATLAAPRVLALARRLRGASVVVQRATGALLVVLGGFVVWGGVRDVVMPSAAAASSTAPESCEGKDAACAVEIGAAAGAPTPVAPGEPHLIEFVGTHCPVCARMAPIVDDVERRCNARGRAVMRVNVDDAAGQSLAARYGIRAVPTFVAVDGSGTEVERFVGAQPRERLEVAVSAVRGEACAASL